MRLAKAFTMQSRSWIFVEMLAALLVIGFVDAISGYQIRLLPFYAAPIFVVAWSCGKRWGLVAGLIAGVISLTADWLDNDPDLQGWTEGWEIMRHLISCVAIALVGSALRAKRDIANARIDLLEHSQRLERQIVGITDAEQRRIGQDLHDGLCQCLAALACSAASLRDDLKGQGLGPEAKAADELGHHLRDAVVQTRDLAHRLVPAHVARVGLPLALDSLAQSVAQLQGINCTFQCHGVTGKYDNTVAKHLYRIAQEAINNATRHGHARNIQVSLEANNGLTTLNIRDDGSGFSPDAINGSGTGLQIMRYRARLNGGALKIEQQAGGGTLVSCTAETHRHFDESAPA
jgi:signal transduction histidine kinase